ncbi:hypothetical protein BZZ01_14375 [Nostocales cyanobacterium HT-58-2]|nr:hypothetical protein BZZ01_14375 [Nostocales cyanobacterium HT-58-2]
MGSILVVFAGVLYYHTVLDELEDLDRLLYQKSRVMAVNAKYDLRRGQLDLENVPILGSNVPPVGTDLVYGRWYNPRCLVKQHTYDLVGEQCLKCAPSEVNVASSGY